MSTLPIKYRPGTFDDVVGNGSTVRTIKSKVQLQAPPHVYLITGPAGTGKTSMAYLIAKALNAFDRNNFTELDAAAYGGKEEVRKIRKIARFLPNGKNNNRLWLMDECHKLSADAQEALLILFEKPPPKSYFVLCTTEPPKLKSTLKRRCTHFELNSLDDDTITQALSDIVEKEEKKVPGKIIEEIVENSNGSMGMALNHLDRIIDLSKKDMKKQVRVHEKVKTEAIELCRALTKKVKWKDVAVIIKNIDAGQHESVRRAVLGYSANILLKKDAPKSFLIMDAFIDPFYTDPRSQLIKAAYECLYAE